MTTKQPLSFLIILLLLTAISTLSVSASDDDPFTSWEIEQRCVGDFVRDSDWTYPGTLLFSGYGGVHGMQADWQTPHIVIFYRTEVDNQGYRNYPILGQQISPNGQWMAIPIGETWSEISFNQYWLPRVVRVIRTDDSNTFIDFELNDYDELFRYFPNAYGYVPVQWVNDNQFMFGGLLINFDGTVIQTEFLTNRQISEDTSYSPDMTRFWGRSRFNGSSIIEGLINLDTFEPLTVQPEISDVTWRYDSNVFIALEDGEDWSGLSSFDRDGNFIERIFGLDTGRVNFDNRASGRNNLGWSPDGTQFAFVYDVPYPEDNRLMIADFTTNNITDTCLSPNSGVVWSPNGTMLAFLQDAPENLSIVVLDMETFQIHEMARHSGLWARISMPDMVGWRSPINDN